MKVFGVDLKISTEGRNDSIAQGVDLTIGKPSIHSVAYRLKKQITGFSNEPSSMLDLKVNIKEEVDLRYTINDESLEATMNEESKYGGSDDEFDDNQ